MPFNCHFVTNKQHGPAVNTARVQQGKTLEQRRVSFKTHQFGDCVPMVKLNGGESFEFSSIERRQGATRDLVDQRFQDGDRRSNCSRLNLSIGFSG